MTPDKIIEYHRDIALWEGLISRKFRSYCRDNGISNNGLLDLLGFWFFHDLSNIIDGCNHYFFSNDLENPEEDFYEEEKEDYYFYEDGYSDSIGSVNEEELRSKYADYCDFCEKRLFSHHSPKREQTPDSAQRDIEDWEEYFNKATVNEKILSYVIKSFSPFEIICYTNDYDEVCYDLHDEYYIEPEELLSFCDREKKQKLLFNAIISLIFNAILTETYTKSVNRHEYSQLLYKSLVNRIEGEYLDPYDLFVLLKDLEPEVCKSFLLGFGLNRDDTGAIIAHIKSNEDGKVVDHIIKQREKGFLKTDSKLIEFCFEFISAQKEDKFIDWFMRFHIKSDELQELNAGLWHYISEKQLFSQEILTSLKESIYPKFSFTSSDIPEWVKKDNTPVPISWANGRFIRGSMKYVLKDKLIDVLIKKWVDNNETEDEVKRKLNYFFNDGPISEMPQNPDTYKIGWSKPPKPQLIYLLIRMLYNDKWNITADKIVKINETTKRIEINDDNLKDLPKMKGFGILPIVNDVFDTEAKGFTQKKVAERLDHYDTIIDLVEDILECAKDEYKILKQIKP